MLNKTKDNQVNIILLFLLFVNATNLYAGSTSNDGEISLFLIDEIIVLLSLDCDDEDSIITIPSLLFINVTFSSKKNSIAR